MVSRFHCAALCGVLSLVAGVDSTFAQTTVLAEARTISGGDLTTNVAPVEKTLTVATAGSYNVTLTDLQVPAQLGTAMLAVTLGTKLVANATLTAGAPAVAHFDATPGTYIVHVVVGLASTQTSGTVGVQATNAADGTPLAVFTADNGSPVSGFTASLALANTALPSTEHVIDTMVTLADSGQHTVDLLDLAYPASLQALQMILTDPNGAVVPGFPLIATAGVAPTSATFTATPGSYHLVALGQIATGGVGGLYNVRIEGAGGAADVFNETDAVGQVVSLGKATLAAGQDTVAFSDFAFSGALSLGNALVLQGSVAVASTAGPQNPTFTAVAGDYQVFALAVPGATGFGAYGVTIGPQGGAAVFSAAQTAFTASSGITAYTFPVQLPTAGSYKVRLADFQFPQAFSQLSLSATQNGVQLGTALSAPGTLTVSAASGPLTIFVAAQQSPVSGKGVFGVDVTPAAGGAATFATTEGVGAAFGASKVTITTAGSYDVTVSDLGFPVNFTDLSAVVTQGATQLGSIYGGGKFTIPQATPGTYFINFLATAASISPAVPSVKQTAGTYGVSVASTPPAPTVTLTSSASQVSSGSTVTLTWSSTNATACTASGGWSGTLATSGTQASSAITASTTFTLACTGPSGTTTQAVTVTATSDSGHSGGGGSIDTLMLALLAGLAALHLVMIKQP